MTICRKKTYYTIVKKVKSKKHIYVYATKNVDNSSLLLKSIISLKS